jgi:predicted RNase H-like nuclease (RuvC/YqgF family)
MYEYKKKLKLNVEEVAANMKILGIHRAYVNSAQEMEDMKRKVLERQRDRELLTLPTGTPIQNLDALLDKRVEELRREIDVT